MTGAPNPPQTSRLFLTPRLLLLASTLIYFSPYFFGSFQHILASGQRVDYEYSAKVGIAVYFILTILFATAFAFPTQRMDFSRVRHSSAEAMVLLMALLSLLVFVVADGTIFALNKSEMLNSTNRFHLSFYQVAMLSFVFCVLSGIRNNKFLFWASLGSLLLILYAGHRSALVIAAVGSCYVIYRSRPISRRDAKLVMGAVVLFLSLAVYKSIYVAVKRGDWGMVVDRLSPENIVASGFVGMEQFWTFAHLDFIITSDFRLSCTNIWAIPFSVIPFMDDILAPFYSFKECSYNAQVQPEFFSGYSGGVAANIWAEFFGYFGYLGFPVLIIILCGFFGGIEFVIRKVRSPLLVSALVVAIVHMSFYIQRNELFGGFISAKRAITIALMLFLVAWFLRIASQRQRVA
jgi:hypothetical protein